MYYCDVVRNMLLGTLDDKAKMVWDLVKVLAEHFERLCFLQSLEVSCD